MNSRAFYLLQRDSSFQIPEQRCLETKLDRLSLPNPQVLALARSGALRGRRRVSPSALPQTPPATSKTAATTKTAAPKRRVAKGKPRDAGSNLKRHESSGEKLCLFVSRSAQAKSAYKRVLL